MVEVEVCFIFNIYVSKYYFYCGVFVLLWLKVKRQLSFYQGCFFFCFVFLSAQSMLTA